MGPDPAEQVALCRYRVIAEALSERLSSAARGRLVRELAARAHELPDGSRKEFSRTCGVNPSPSTRSGGPGVLVE
jgi:hypothetical protein